MIGRSFLLATLAVAFGTGAATADDKASQGEKVFKRTCGACHALEPGKNRVGPTLAGVVGRKAASVDGFKYSDPMTKSGVTWTEENLHKYLADPKGFIPGNKMAFAGLRKEEEREAVIDYLETVKAGS